MKKLIAVGVLALAPFASAYADSDAGCGVGTQVWKGQKGLAPKVLAATTNNTFFNTISMTFGVLGCTNDGVVTGAARVPMFASTNLDQLAAEMAAGQGETLTTLASLYNVSEADRPAFYALAKANYGVIFARADVTTADVLAAMDTAMKADARLAVYVA